MKLVLSILLMFVLKINLIIGQNKIDFGLFIANIPNKIEVRIKPNYTISNNMTNTQFTVKWPISSGITSLIDGADVSSFAMAQQGPPYINNGYYYQVWVNTAQGVVALIANQEIVIHSFAYAGLECPIFEIASDPYVYSINGDAYIEMFGANRTGIIYNSTASRAIQETPGIITGEESVNAGTNNIKYSIDTLNLASSYSWNYTGLGASINGIGDTVLISFSSEATSGSLTVAGHNDCGDGPSSSALVINVLHDMSIENNYANNNKEIKIYPNPSVNNVVFIDIEGDTNNFVNIEIFNTLSVLVKIYNINRMTNSTKTIYLDISDIKSGYYLAKVMINNEVFIGKIVKN